MSIDAEPNFSVIDKEVTVVNKLAESAAKIAWHHFEWRYLTLVIFNSSVSLGIDAFMRSYQKSVSVGKGAFLSGEETAGDRIRQFVIFGSDLFNVMHILHWMRERQFDNTGKYIVICETCDEKDAMNIFWNYKIINIVLVKHVSVAYDVTGFTYYLYEDENCEISQPVLLQDSCVKKPCLDMFPIKLGNFHSCPLIVSTFIQKPYMSLDTGVPRGADGDLLVLIGDALNATLKPMTPFRGDGWGIQGSNGIWTGSLGDVYYDLANFSMTSPAVTLKRFTQFHMSTDYNSINMVWVTHPAIPLPAWQKLVRPFQMKARISLAATFMIVVIVALFFNLWRKSSEIIRVRRLGMSLIFNSWTICMGMPTTTIPSKPALLYVFLLWVMYCFMIRTFYQASLIHAMKDHPKYPEFENLDDILNSGYAFGGVSTLKEYFVEEPRVIDNWVPINSTDIWPTLYNLSDGMKYVLAMNMDTAKSFLLHRYGELHIVTEKIVTTPTCLFFKKFSPIAAALNRVLGRLTEGGFTEKLYKNHASQAIVKKVEGTTPMNMDHYMGCYIVLAIGWLASTLAFIVELYYYKCAVKFQNVLPVGSRR